MPNNTPVYGIPYQGLLDQPHGPNLGEKATLKIESVMAAIDARLALIEQGQPYRDEKIVSGTVGSVTFTGIPSTLKTVRIEATARGDAASGATELMVRVNGDATNNYRHNAFFSQNGGAPSNGSVIPTSSARVNVIPGGTATAGVFGANLLSITGWNSPHASHLGGVSVGGYIDTSGNQIIYAGSIVYLGAGPYTTITLLPITGNFVAGCAFYLEGLR